MDLENQLKELYKKEKGILKEIDERNAKKEIQCKSCEEHHQIGGLKAIQTLFYVPPTGCCGGDYWLEGEIQFVCPKTGVRNRLLFNNNDVPWPERDHYENNPEKQFQEMYKRLFRSITKVEEKQFQDEGVNNWYVDENRGKFGLVEKKK